MQTEINEIRIPRWFDRHLHLREGSMLANVLPSTLNQRPTGALIMPNLDDPVTTIEKAIAYRKQIINLVPEDNDFNPRMSAYLTDHSDPEEIVRGFKEGVWVAAKLYMADKKGEGGTTNSSHGVRDLLGLYKVFAAMEKVGMPLLGHFEVAEEDVDEFDREKNSLERDLMPLVKCFEGLPIVVEHVTDYHTAVFVAEADHPIYATVTPQHMLFNRNALFKGGLNSINWCKPVLKRENHRKKILQYATSGNPRFGAGTDSAPHPKTKKEACCGCAAGAFTAPLAPELYATLFDQAGKLHNLDPFMSQNLLHLYGMEVSKETMTIKRMPFEVPKMVGDVHVFKGGETLQWKLVGLH